MTEILTALIGAGGLILVAVIGLRTSGRVKSIQGQVQNDHSTNLREELDERHDETRRWFRALWDRHDITDSRIDTLTARLDRIEGKDPRP